MFVYYNMILYGEHNCNSCPIHGHTYTCTYRSVYDFSKHISRQDSRLSSVPDPVQWKRCGSHFKTSWFQDSPKKISEVSWLLMIGDAVA